MAANNDDEPKEIKGEKIKRQRVIGKTRKRKQNVFIV